MGRSSGSTVERMKRAGAPNGESLRVRTIQSTRADHGERHRDTEQADAQRRDGGIERGEKGLHRALRRAGEAGRRTA